MKDHALVCSSGGKDILDLLPRHVVSECEVDHLGTGQVDHSSQAGPVLPGHDVGDISDIAIELFAGTKMPLGKVPSPLCF